MELIIRQVGKPEKTAVWLKVEQRRGKFEKEGIKLITRALIKQSEVVIDKMILTRSLSPDFVDAVPEEPLLIEMINLYKIVGVDFGIITARNLRTKKDIFDDIGAIISDFMESFVRRNVGERITSITRTTRVRLKRIIHNAIDMGLSINDTVKNIREDWGDIVTVRARMIARTEIVSASNAGSLAGAISSGVSAKKVWLATKDDRTRAAHLEADGQVKDLNQPFMVGGEPLQFPGDPGGSADNVIGCRCTQIYQV